MTSSGVPVQRIPVDHPPVPASGGVEPVEAGTVAVGEDAVGLPVLGQCAPPAGVLHRPGDVMEPAGPAPHAHGVRVIGRHQH